MDFLNFVELPIFSGAKVRVSLIFSEYFLMLKGENLEIVNFPSVDFLNFVELPIFSEAKVRVSIGKSDNFLMLRGENPEIVNSLLKFFRR
ncbi:hypothetical protein D4Z78_19730 [Okeania hirsuta]|nr:hypothetical protein D4Z78_19730 [Okeania hirsuta]